MSSDRRLLGERVFATADVARLAGLSLRQLQWWDERRVVSAGRDERRRIYAPEQVLEVLTVAALREKGLSLQKIRRVLRFLRRDADRAWSANSDLFLITDGRSVFLEDRPQDVLDRFLDSHTPLYLVSLSDQVKRLSAEQTARRHDANQLMLFEE